MWTNPPDAELRELLRATRSIAIVGASPNPDRAACWIGEYLRDAGYEVVPVRPGGAVLLGRAAIASLAELPAPVDLAVVFRARRYVAGHVEEAIAAGLPALWLQDGVVDLPAAQRARAAGLRVVMNDCIYRVHARLLGG